MGQESAARTAAGMQTPRSRKASAGAESSAQVERIGVAVVDAAFSSMGWAFREQGVADHGVDALVEVDGLTNPTGRFIAVQIKCGQSYFRRKSSNGWSFSGNARHLSYWLAYLMPVVLVLVDPDTHVAHWVQVTYPAVRYTKNAWLIEVPARNVLGDSSRAVLRALAFSPSPALADPVDAASPLLPASAVEMLSALRQVDHDGALRLAKFLSQGRDQPRPTVETLLKASGSWPQATALRLATIGAYANEHGHQDLAMDSFALAAEKDEANRVRLSSIAALMALSAGDRVRAANLLRPAREQRGRNLLADVVACVFDADESGRDDALETMLRDVPDDQLDEEPTCLLFLADRAILRADLDAALKLYERAYKRYPRIVGGRLGKARVLIERMVVGRSALPSRDQREAVELAIAVRDDMRRWDGPSEDAHRLVVQERMLAGAFAEVILLATPKELGGQASERESADPTIAILAAEAAVALSDRPRAGRFGDAVRGTPAESLIRALAADPHQPLSTTIALWRSAFEQADTTLAARMCLSGLATHGALVPRDLEKAATLANLDDNDRALFTARNAAAQGDLDVAVGLLQAVGTPAAGEMLIETLRNAGRYAQALAACDELWAGYGAVKALQEKVNVLGLTGDYAAAEVCASQLLAIADLPDEQRSRLHDRLIGRSMQLHDWASAEARCRAAIKDHVGEPRYAWGLIMCQLNQGRWDTAWASYCQLTPDIDDPDVIPAWVDLHLKFGVCLANGVSGGSLAGFGCGEPVAEGDGERVDGWLPSHCPSGSADPGRIQGPGDQVEAL